MRRSAPHTPLPATLVVLLAAAHPTPAAAGSPPPPQPASHLPYQALGSVDVGTGESSIFLFNGTRYLLDNIFCGWIDHYGQWDPRFRNHSYVRIREFASGRLVANVTESIGTSFVSAFVDHDQPGGDVLWLSANNDDRCNHGPVGRRRQANFPSQIGVLSLSSRDLKTFSVAMAAPGVGTCNTEVARVSSVAPGLPPHKYVMIVEHFARGMENIFLVNNNHDGDLSHGWLPAGSNGSDWMAASVGKWGGAAPGGGPSIRWEGGRYYVITGGRTVQLCRSKDLGERDRSPACLRWAASHPDGHGAVFQA